MSSPALDDDDRACLVALSGLPGMGPASLLRCRRDGGLRDVWERLCDRGVAPAGSGAAPLEMVAAARMLDPAAVVDRHRRAGIGLLVLGDSAYPARLHQDPAPPAVLFARGDPATVAGPAVAIVGTRNATSVGCELVRHLAAQLAAHGVSVVSGLAAGIDGAAHRPLVDGRRAAEGAGHSGRPVGVVASGLDRPYPLRHRLLHDQVAHHGVLFSEVPLGGRPRPWRFPARNRIIAGLADAVVVAESRSTGGSLSTAAEALDRGVPVLAVPGHPSSPAAAGANDLIADGAAPVRDVEDILVAVGRGGSRPNVPAAGGPAHPGAWSPSACAVLEALEVGPRSLTQVMEGAGTSLAATSRALLELQAAGVVEGADGWYQRSGRDRGRGEGTG